MADIQDQAGAASMVGSVSASASVPPPAGPGTHQPWLWLGIAVVLLVGAAAVLALLGRKRRKPEPVQPTQEPARREITVEKLHEQGARKSQQDSFFVSPAEMIPSHGLLAVVADGMGGLSSGDQVSQTAVRAVMEAFYAAQGAPEQVLLALLARANRAVNELLGPDGLRTGGSTMVAGLIRDGFFHCLSVGDSRICLYRDGTLWQLNREHVFRDELYLRAVNGETTLAGAVGHPQASGLTSFLGMGELKYVDLPARPIAVRPGDIYALMSDGVYNALSDEELTAALERGEGAADALREAIQGKNYSNQDNYTAVLLRC